MNMSYIAMKGRCEIAALVALVLYLLATPVCTQPSAAEAATGSGKSLLRRDFSHINDVPRRLSAGALNPVAPGHQRANAVTEYQRCVRKSVHCGLPATSFQ